MESESGISNTKVSDSGYSVSCSHSNSQRSASSKSRHSGSNSSRSSGYCGGKSIVERKSDEVEHQQKQQLEQQQLQQQQQQQQNLQQQQQLKRNKSKEHKKKKIKSVLITTGNDDNFICSPKTDVQTVPVIDSRDVKNSEFTDPVAGVVITFNDAAETLTTNKHSRLAENKDNMVIPPSTTVLNQQQSETPLSGEDVSLWSDPQVHHQDSIMVQDDIIELPSTLDSNTDKEEPPIINNTPTTKSEDGFCCVISIYDGVVLYTTPSLTTVLGFPKDMWLGRSFIDFVHPKDRETFSNQVTNGVCIPLADVNGQFKDVKHSIHVCLRKYRGLKTSGFGVVEKAVAYQTFHLTVTFKHITDSPQTSYIENSGGMFLVVVAVPVYSSYKVPDEKRKSTKFGMRHTASCIFTHVDPDVVTNFGFLPQDMLGKSVFDFYHPEDMPFLKEVYESVMQMCHITGSVFRSKPYRFAVQNGGFAIIETEWSSFVNPWSRRLEFVIGLHRVIQGPTNPDIFERSKNDETKYVSEEVLKESKIIQGEILLLLSKELPKPNEAIKQEVSRRCKDLATFMENLMEEVSKSTLQLNLPQNSNPTDSERDSVMLGEISPHHDYYDSKSSSETPPSYNQLNYNENIQRFFQSKPKTTVSDESVNSADVEPERKNCSNNNQKCLSPIQNSGASGSGSAGNLSSGSNQNMESGTTSITNNSNDPYKPPHLTEELLTKHNEDMEKMMIQKHREQRFGSKESKKHSQNKTVHKADCKEDEQVTAHGVKRGVSHSWEGDSYKVSKHYKHQVTNNNNMVPPSVISKHKTKNNAEAQKSGAYYDESNAKTNDVNLWPPFSVTVTPINNTHTCNSSRSSNNGTFATGMFPVYYIPAQQHPVSQELVDMKVPPCYQVQYMPGMIYNYSNIYPMSPIICSPLPVVPVPVAHPLTPMSTTNNNIVTTVGSPIVATTSTAVATGTSLSVQLQNPTPERINKGINKPIQQLQRTSSQATSVKAEPGSGMGSIASASIANKAMSECSRKDIGLQSVCSPDTPLVSPPDGETDMEIFNIPDVLSSDKGNLKYRVQQDEETSCYSSSYSSFFKTDTGSGSNDDSIAVDVLKVDSKEASSSSRKQRYPVRKRDPPWLESISVTPELVYRYEMAVRGLTDILESDLNALKDTHQPILVNDQLNQLYVEMELEGLSTKLTIEEGVTSSSSGGEDNIVPNVPKQRRKRRSYSSLVMIYEENAPFPPPDNA